MTEQEKRTILIVDDAEENCELLQGILGREYDTSVARDGPAALRSVAEHRPDLVLLDIMMPGMDGFDVCGELQRQGSRSEIPVIFISALDAPADKVRAFDAGGVDYVTKPFQAAEVRARVGIHMKLHQLRHDLEERNGALEKSYADLRKLEDLRENLTSMIIHDMRTPLAAIGAGLTLLAKGSWFSDPVNREYLAQTRAAAQELSSMVNSLLDITRLEAGEMPLRMELHDLEAIAEGATTQLKASAEVNGITITAGTGSVSAAVDADLMRRVFENLIGNAIKFTQPGGAIDVRVMTAPGAVRAEVRDTGRGIPPAFHAKIFEKFVQVEDAIGMRKQSTGLGLAFCKLAVEAQGGRIGVQSEVGKGTTFWFELPVGTSDTDHT